MDFIESTYAASSGNNLTIYEVCGDHTGGHNRNGQGGGKATIHGGSGSRVGGRGGKRKCLQEDVDACTHFTEQPYSNERYEKFSPVERQ